MTTALQTVDPNSIQAGSVGAPLGSEMFFSQAQEQMILKTFLGGASKEEAVVLLETVRRRRLDPFSRQVYFVKRWDAQKREEVWAIQTSIDGLRSIAERSGRYEGQTKPEWCGDDGVWHDVWLKSTPPSASRVGVHKAGFREPAYGIARLGAYLQTKKDGSPTSFWQKMPDLMLAKCAEALAIRKAFPEDTAGLYIPEEMGKDGGEEEHKPAQRKPAAVAPAKVVDALPAAPEPAPAEEVIEVGAAPGDAFALWDRLEADRPQTAGAEWQKAATAVFGGRFPPAKQWTPEQTQAVERVLFPEKA